MFISFILFASLIISAHVNGNGDIECRARICKRLRSPGNDSARLCNVAWQAGTSNRAVVPARQAGYRFLGLCVLSVLRFAASTYGPASIGSFFTPLNGRRVEGTSRL